jgi:hypothetical protein
MSSLMAPPNLPSIYLTCNMVRAPHFVKPIKEVRRQIPLIQRIFILQKNLTRFSAGLHYEAQKASKTVLNGYLESCIKEPAFILR